MKMPSINPMAHLRQVFDKVKIQLTSVYAKLDDERIEARDRDAIATVTLNGRARVEAVSIDLAALAKAMPDGASDADRADAIASAIVAAARTAYVTSEALRKEMSKKATGGLLPKGVDLPLEAI